MSLSLQIRGRDFPIKVWKFPAGEVGVLCENLPEDVGTPHIILHYQGNDDLFALIQLNEILRKHTNRVVLDIPYLPYARQDRVCNRGEAFALKLFTDFINNMDFEFVVVKDVHSEVSLKLLNTVVNTTQDVCAMSLPTFDILLAPDKGAALKIGKMQQASDNILYAEKARDSEGRIIGTVIKDVEKMQWKDVCVVDDICDGGATFIKLAEEIERQGVVPKSLSLYVTHGIFSKGIDIIFKKYDNIYVHNLMCADSKNLITII